jgi:hypothetical protein
VLKMVALKRMSRSLLLVAALTVLLGQGLSSSTTVGAAEYTGDCADCVGVIGDSLTYQNGTGITKIRDQLVADGWDPANIRVDGIIGRPIAADFSGKPGAVTTINNWKNEGFDPKVYAIFLGSNNKNATTNVWTTEINKVLTAIGPGHTIVWMDLGFRNAADSRVMNFNANLANIAGQTEGMSVAKSSNNLGWNDWIHTQPNQDSLWLSTDVDGVHMTTAGYNLRNQFIGQAMLPFAPTGDPEPPTTVEYITNSSVEADLNGWGGVTSSASLIARSAEAAYDGTVSVKSTNKTSATAATVGFGSTTNNGSQHWVSNTVAGRTYNGSVWVKAGAAGQTIKLFMKEFRPDGSAPVSPSVTTTWVATDTNWHQLTAAYQAKEAGNSLQYRVWQDNVAPSGYFYADGMRLFTNL